MKKTRRRKSRGTVPLKVLSSKMDLAKSTVVVPRRLFFAAQQRIAITLIPNYYQKMQRFTTRKNQEEHGPDVK